LQVLAVIPDAVVFLMRYRAEAAMGGPPAMIIAERDSTATAPNPASH